MGDLSGAQLSHRKLGTGLSSLPPTLPTCARPPWSVVTTSHVMEALSLDRGLWMSWRCRGITPPTLPAHWFRAASGNPLYYRLDVIEGWLAGRRGEPFSTIECWDVWLRSNAGLTLSSWAEVRAFARRWAEGDGPVLDDGGVRFTKLGFAAYLDSLGDAS